jgi:all-trans-retinol 13,14-reductase
MTDKIKPVAIIIGAGAAGLSAAAYMSKNGFKVKLFEKHNRIGGCVHTFQKGRYKFEFSTHQTVGFNYNRYMKMACKFLGIKKSIPVKGNSLDEFIRFENGKIVKRIFFPTGRNNIKKALYDYFPKSKKDINRFLKDIKKIANQALALRVPARALNVVPYLFDTLAALWLRDGKGPLKAIGKLRYSKIVKYINITLRDYANGFKDPDLKWLIEQYWYYLGVPPTRMSAIILATMAHLFFIDGPYLFKDGMNTLMDEMGEIIKNNDGEIFTGNEVTEIIVENNLAKGIRTKDGKEFTGDVIISDICWENTFLECIKDNSSLSDYINQLKGLKNSTSAFGIYLGLKCDIADYGFKAPSMLFNRYLDGDKDFELYKNGPTDETAFLMSNYCESDLGFAPEGCNSIAVLELDYYDRWKNLSKKDLEKEKKRCADIIINKVEKLTGIPVREKLEELFIISPVECKNYNSHPDASILSTELSVDQSLRKRTAAETPIENLYMTGPLINGPGVSMSIDSGIAAANIVIRSGKYK